GRRLHGAGLSRARTGAGGHGSVEQPASTPSGAVLFNASRQPRVAACDRAASVAIPGREHADSMTIVIRPATETDYDDVADVWARSFYSNGFATAPLDETITELRGRIPEEMANGWHLYVADDGGVVAAMLAFRTRDNFLSQIFVAPEYQRRGVGKMLLAFTRQ